MRYAVLVLLVIFIFLVLYRTSSSFLSRKFAEIYRKFDESVSEAALFIGTALERMEDLNRDLEQKEHLFKDLLKDIQEKLPIFRMLENLSEDEEFYGAYFSWKKGMPPEKASSRLGIPVQKIELLYSLFKQYSSSDSAVSSEKTEKSV